MPDSAREAIADALMEWPWDEPGSQFAIRPEEEDEEDDDEDGEEEEGEDEMGRETEKQKDVATGEEKEKGDAASANALLLRSNMMSLHCMLNYPFLSSLLFSSPHPSKRRPLISSLFLPPSLRPSLTH